ncbi:Uncharacterised protein [Bordetella pertussis]|nr:Uncharacterised protein [Bordetella pertussis]CFO05838.1 Uncharacterised protein [Bordetella pertussis]CFP13755.1 Uncharacterised protein [Bordetella pertussis]CFP62589.1 Uncharacterised protein [Bordetella pertussis]CFP62906.1 Uncharacterised protein [Bordetella pertussis]
MIQLPQLRASASASSCRRRASDITEPSGYWCDGVTKMKRGGCATGSAGSCMPSSSTSSGSMRMPLAISTLRAPQ